MIYYILLQTSTEIISLKNTTTNRHIETANLIYIALIVTLQMLPYDSYSQNTSLVYAGNVERNYPR